MNVQDAQAAVMPKEDLTPHAGKWVAIRDGKVVAVGVSLFDLRQYWDVVGVMVMPVPHPGLRV